MNIIYQPKGRAREYASLALNIYKWCLHGCLYCFGPLISHSKRGKYFSAPNPKKDVIKRVQKDAQILRNTNNDEEILISFIGDPYQPAEIELELTRHTLEILIQYDLRFTILTKGGMRAVRDFDLLSNYPKARFGTTLIFTDQKDADYWEPGAASVSDRIKAIEKAHARGIRTWISVEPVIKLDQALQLIQNLHPIVDHWKIGKINYNKEIEKSVNWIKFREEVKELLNSIGADYYLKKSLTELRNLNQLSDDNKTYDKRAFTIKEVSEYACVSRSTVENWLAKGILSYEEIPGIGKGKYCFRRIRKKDLDEFLNKLYNQSNFSKRRKSSSKVILLPRNT